MRGHVLRARVAVVVVATVALVAAAGPVASTAHAQSRNTEHTLKLDDPSEQPTASFDDIVWMIGSWEGEAFGGTFEEDWLPPSAGSMTGVFKLIHEGHASMYEFMRIVRENDSLAVQIKHFNADFTGWEDKSEFVSFPLVKLTEDAAYFDGLTYRRLDVDRLVVHVSVRETKEEHQLDFVRSAVADAPRRSSPYAGLETREIKALSAAKIESLRAGDGMGLAMAAELNGYPGPKHVLELQRELKLSSEQFEATKDAFGKMHSAATALGNRIVEAEQSLDRSFAQHEIARESLEAATRDIARLRGELRAVHLSAHLEMVEILSAEQRHAYGTLRGYGGSEAPAVHHPGIHQGHGN